MLCQHLTMHDYDCTAHPHYFNIWWVQTSYRHLTPVAPQTAHSVSMCCCAVVVRTQHGGTSKRSSTVQHAWTFIVANVCGQSKPHCNKRSIQAHQDFIARRVAHPFNPHLYTCWRLIHLLKVHVDHPQEVTLASCACPFHVPCRGTS